MTLLVVGLPGRVDGSARGAPRQRTLQSPLTIGVGAAGCRGGEPFAEDPSADALHLGRRQFLQADVANDRRDV